MEIDFEAKMSAKTDDELLNVIENRMKYVPDAINAAVAESQSRGHLFSIEELESIQTDIALKVKERNREEVTEYTYSDDMAIFPDNELAVYYSKRAINNFSIFFTTLFGTVLLAINLKGNRRGAIAVVAFGIVYTGLSFYALNLLPERNSFLTIIVNGIGGIILTKLFWPKYIGDGTQYKARSIWVPLIISIAITVFSIMAILAMLPE